MQKMMRTAYELARQPTWPLVHFKTMVKVQRENGVRLLSGKDDIHAAREFVNCIDKAVTEKCAAILTSSTFFSVLTDGSQARKTGYDKEMVLVRTERQECTKYFKGLKKHSQLALVKSLDKVIWNWIETFPDEFAALYKEQDCNLADSSEKMFLLVDTFSESSKKRTHTWPLQIMLLLLCPYAVNEVSGHKVNANSQNYHKKYFIENVKKALISGKAVSESAAVACVQLCKASTFISREDNIVSFLVAQVLNELKGLLFNANKILSTPNGTDIEDLMIDCFVASYRINYRNNQHFEICLSPEAPTLLQIVLVKGLHTIAIQKVQPWWPTLEAMCSKADQLRSLFHNCIGRVGNVERTTSKSHHRSSIHRRHKKNDDEVASFKRDAKLLLWLVKLFHANPILALSNAGKEGHEIQATSLKFLLDLVDVMILHSSLDVSDEAAETLLCLHQTNNIELWNPAAPIATFWDVSSNVLYHVADRLMSEKSVNQLKMMKWLQEILKCRVAFVMKNKEHATIGTHIPICYEALSKLEVVFLTSLWSSEIDQVMLAVDCFALLYEEACLLETASGLSTIYPSPLQTVYYRMAEGVHKISTVGRTALQKQIMAVLRCVDVQTSGNLQAFEVTMVRWKHLTKALTSYPREEFPVIDTTRKSNTFRKSVMTPQNSVTGEVLEVYISEWTNMTGFLCSLAGICTPLKTDEKVNGLTEVNGDCQTHPNNATADAKIIAIEYPITKFLSELEDLLVCNNEHTSLQIRSTVKECLGLDLSPVLYPLFFISCKTRIEGFFHSIGQPRIKEPHTLYIEQIIYVLKCILDNKAESVTNILDEFPVDEVLLFLIRYIRNLPITVQSLVIKAKLCQLVESIMCRKNELSFKQEMKFRNKLVEYLTDWLLHIAEDCEDISAEILAISCTLDEAAVKAIVVLLKGLPLQPDNVDSDVMDAKSQLFLKHFTLFMNILNKCYELPEDKSPKPGIPKHTLAPHYANLRASTVQAMSNMLSSNIDCGLMHSIGLGYHEDPQTRATFMEVMTDILKQGTEFENLAETVLEDRFERLVSMITLMDAAGEFPIAMALANVIGIDQMDDFARVLVTVFDIKGLLFQLYWNLFRQEVRNTESMQTLFRGNTLASKTMTISFKMFGSRYLQLLLEPLLLSMSDDGNQSYEADPARLEPGEDIDVNRKRVNNLITAFVDRVSGSKEFFPPQLSGMSHILYKVVEERFEDRCFDAVTSTIFLRFINPAIVSPHHTGILYQRPTDKMRRGLMLLSKILQNLANHVLFTKEAHMEVFNTLLAANFHRLQTFFQDISAAAPLNGSEQHGYSLVSNSNVLTLHKLLWTHQEKIGAYMALNRDYKTVGRAPFEKMATLLAHLGPPDSQHVKLQKDAGQENVIGSKFEEFMAKYAGQNQEDLKGLKSLQLFYQEGRSKAGNPVFYYIARRFKKDQINDEILIYHFLSTLSTSLDQQWELVVDLSHTHTENGLRSETISKAFHIFPKNLMNSLVCMYLFNCGTYFRQYVKANERFLNPFKNQDYIIPIDNLNKFNDYIEPSALHLPSSTTTLEDDIKIYSGQKVFNKWNACFLRLGPNNVQIQACERTKILGYSVLINDVYYATEIEGATVQDDLLELRFSTGTPNLKFITSSAEEIAQAVLHIQARWKLSQPNKDHDSNSKKIRPKDVPGTVLNMALLNLGSKDPSLRLAAYNLLCALTATFGLRVEERLLEAKGLCIPANNTMFIKSISEQLAKREPNMTLEFLEECINGFSKSDYELKHLCLEYMAPWLPNLTKFCRFVSNDPSRIKMVQILDRLIVLTIEERQLYPSIQAKVWGNIGVIPELLDVVLDCFIRTSATGGMGSVKAEVMADTAVALAAVNVKLVSSKVINRLHTVIARTCVSPTVFLEQHLMWDDIAILARYLLMLSFNDCLDVSNHLADILHITTLLVSTGPLSLRASIHGLVINSLQSLLTCSGITFQEKTQRLLKTRLEDFSLQKFYLLFGISKVKSAPVRAFQAFKPTRTLASEDEKAMTLSSLETIVDVLLEIVEACIVDIPDCQWLQKWHDLTAGYAFQHNPALQPRAIMVLGCITKQANDNMVRNLLQILVKAVGIYQDSQLVAAVIMCLTRLQPQLKTESRYHRALFWIAIGVLQLTEISLFPCGLALLEQNLSTLDGHGAFNERSVGDVLMEVRKEHSIDWFCKQMDHIVGLSFTSNFNFALAAHILKGLHHPFAKTKSSAVRILNLMLKICTKHLPTKDKFIVTDESVAYLAGLLPLSEEVRSRLHAEGGCIPNPLTMTLSRFSSTESLDKTSKHVSIFLTSPEDEFEDERNKTLWPTMCHNMLLDRGVLKDKLTQALLFVLLTTLVEFTMDDAEARVLYEVLAEASIAYTEVFSICFGILHRKLCNTLSHCDDPITLAAVQTIVQSTSSISSDKQALTMEYLQGSGFSGLHTFPGPFIEIGDPAIAPQMFSRLVDAVVEVFAPTPLSPDARSGSPHHYFKGPPPSTNDEVATLSSSLNAISNQMDNTNDEIKTFKRVGSYRPLKLHSKNQSQRRMPPTPPPKR